MIGIIGGSGLDAIPGVEGAKARRVKTPFGAPSDAFTIGRLGGADVAFLPRHARGHRLLPSEVPYRANIWALKKLGATHVLSFSAVGSLVEDVRPGDIVLVDQFIDRTRARPRTFFGRGIVAHVGMADPTCPEVRAILADAILGIGLRVFLGGAYICIEGPQFSTRAESHAYRSLGARVIGMTNLPEAYLAREAEMCYQTVALATDYDCWREREESVTVEAILSVLRQNVDHARRIIAGAVPRLAGLPRSCGCSHALEQAIVTDPKVVPASVKRDLAPILGGRIA